MPDTENKAPVVPEIVEPEKAIEEKESKPLSFLSDLTSSDNETPDKDIALDWFIDVITNHPEIKKIEKKQLLKKYDEIRKKGKKATKEERDFFTYNGKFINLHPSYLTDTLITKRMRDKKIKPFTIINHGFKGWEFSRGVQLSTTV